MAYVMKAFDANQKDAEIILNLVEITILEKQWNKAKLYIKHYLKHKDELQFFDRKQVYYDEKIRIFQEYVESDEIKE
jgi:hypothetical protein